MFDMNELIFVDSTGVGALLNICNQLSALSTPFYFVNLTSDVSEVFDILGLSMAIGEEHFNFHSTEEALSHLVMLNNEKN
nr:STAS domain-containing protein [Caldalkalibacillus mannanilyticus]